MECSRSGRPMMTSGVETDGAGSMTFMSGTWVPDVSNHKPYLEFWYKGKFSRQQVVLVLMTV